MWKWLKEMAVSQSPVTPMLLHVEMLRELDRRAGEERRAAYDAALRDPGVQWRDESYNPQSMHFRHRYPEDQF